MDFISAKNLFLFPIEADTEDEYKVGTPFRLSRIAEISQTTEQAQNVVYYDDVAAYAVNSVGATTVTVTCEALSLDVLAKIKGRELTADTGLLIDSGEAKPVDFALVYEAGYVGGGGARYYAFHKVAISIPDEASKTKDAGTDTLNQSLTITCVSTTHKFEKTNEPCKCIFADTPNSKIDLSTWYTTLVTPDNAVAKTA